MDQFLKTVIDEASAKFHGRTAVPCVGVRERFGNLSDLEAAHFRQYSSLEHPCRTTLVQALELLQENPATIVETGSAAHGTKSSLLFDSYVNSFGGSFHSVDNRLEPTFTLNRMLSRSSTLYCDDSVSFLKKAVARLERIDLIYLDSWDLDLSDPIPSALHGLNELLSVLPYLKPKALILIDDTPKDIRKWQLAQGKSTENKFLEFEEKYHFPPGKGAIINILLDQLGIGKRVAHEYQLLWQL